MPTKKERQGILKVFFEKNLDEDVPKENQDQSKQIQCPGFTFVISKAPAGQFTLSRCNQGVDTWQVVNDDQEDHAIGLLGKKLIFEDGKKLNAEYLEACLNAGASLKDKNATTGVTPLHYAAHENNLEACKLLVEKGADIFAVDRDGKTALGISPEGEAKNFLTEKREKLCKHYYNQFSPSTPEKKNQVLEAFYEFLPQAADGAVREFYDRDNFRRLIEEHGGEYGIHAVNAEGTKMEIYPWEIGYALNDLGKTAIFQSIDTADTKLLEACLNVGVSANEKHGNGNSALFHAARAGNSELCELLIENGANVSAANDLGKDALMIAAEEGHEEVCRLLIEKGADILRMDKSGKTAASYSQGNGKILDLLRSKQKERYEENRGVELDSAKTTEILSAFYVHLGGVTANDESKNFLHQNGRKYQIVKAVDEFKLQETNGTDLEDWESSYVLRTFGRNLSADDGKGINKFFEAAQAGGESKFIKACLDCGISVDEKDDKGKTALFYARARGDTKTIEVLSKASAEKHKTTNVGDRETQSLLGVFFATKKGLTEKDFDVAEGKYSIGVKTTATDGRKTFFIEVKEGAVNRELLGNEINLAIGDLGRSLIFDAAKSGNTELYKACIKAGASNDDADGEGNRPLTYAKMNVESRKIVHSIAGITKDPTTGGLKKPRDKFRELAIEVREAYIANKEKVGFEKIIQGVIDSFGVRHSGDFTVDGLLASDMIAFIKDIDIEKTEAQTAGEMTVFKLLSKKPDSEGKSGSKVQELIKGKSLEEANSDDDGRRKSFYRQLLISCLEHGHHFLSEERTENIRSLIAKNAQSAGDFALNSVDKDSVVGLYMRAHFEELRKREGLKDDLTYEAFSENLGKVVMISSGQDSELNQTKIEDAFKELQALQEKLKIIPNPAEEKEEKELREDYQAKIDTQNKIIKELEDYKKNNSLDWDWNNRAISALLGSTSKKKKSEDKDYIAHGDLRIALDMMREGTEFTPAEIIKKRNRRELAAATTLGRFYKGMRARLNEADALTIKAFEERSNKVLDFKLKKSETKFDINPENSVEQKDFTGEDYNLNAIKEVKGNFISHGNTGLAVHIFSKASGFSSFNDQVAEANRRERTGSDEVSIAYIKDMPNGDGGVKSSYCVAVLSENGATKIFSEQITKISERSEEVYKKNLEFETRREGINYAIAVLTDARNKLLLGKIFNENGDKITFGETSPDPNFELERELKKLRDEFSDQLAGLRKLLKNSEVNSNESPEEMAKKRLKLEENLKKFMEAPEGLEFKKILEGSNKNEHVSKVIDQKKITKIKELIEGYSSEEMTSKARQMTSRQMRREIAENVKNSMEESKDKFNLNGLEITQAVVAYQNSSLEKLFNLKGKKGFEKLLAEEMPASAYKGISVFRPRGKDNIATVIFNGCEGDDTMYLTLPNTPECYVRVSRCDEDKDVLVWRNGKEITENHKKGDLIIDTGVVFHKKDNGKYKTIPFDKLDELGFNEGVKKAALDFEIKAISVDENQRLSSSTLYSGQQFHFPLEAKNSLIQKVDAHNPEQKKFADVVFNKLGEKTLATDLVVEIGDYAKLIINNDGLEFITDLNTYPVKKEYFTRDWGEENFKKKFDELWRLKQGDFKKGLTDKEYFSHEDLQTKEFTAEIFLKHIYETLEKESKKYAVINSFKDFDLVIPVESKLSNFVPEPNFLRPEIQFEKNGKIKRETLDGEGFKEKIKSLEESDLKNFLSNFFTKEEIGGKVRSKDFIEEEENYKKLCKKINDRCKKAYVTVGFQKVESDGTRNYEPCYKDVGELEKKTFVHTEGILGNVDGARDIRCVERRIVQENSLTEKIHRGMWSLPSSFPSTGKLSR